MATKNNRAGNQQPYIPAGHGDESGEYAGDNYGGSGNVGNKHITLGGETNTSNGNVKQDTPPKTDAKPTQPNQPTDAEKKRLDEVIGKDTKSKEDVESSIINKVTSKSLVKNVKEWIKDGDEKTNAIVEKYLGNINITRRGSSHFKPADGSINFKSQANSESFYHENGHSIDYKCGADIGIVGRASTDYISEKYGVSLQDALLSSFKEKPYLYAEIKDYYDEMSISKKNAKAKELGYEYNKLKEKAEEISKDWDNTIQQTRDKYKPKQLEIQNQKDAVFNEWLSGKIDRDGYNAKINPLNEQEKEIRDLITKEILELGKSVGRENEILHDIDYQVRKELNKQFADISDVLDGAGYNYPFGSGHGKSYWRRSKDLRGIEFFAEVFSAKTVNKESYDLMKMFFPKAVDIFEEIYDKVGK